MSRRRHRASHPVLDDSAAEAAPVSEAALPAEAAPPTDEAIPELAPPAPVPEPPGIDTPPPGVAGADAGATLHGAVEVVDEAAFEAAADPPVHPSERVELLPDPPPSPAAPKSEERPRRAGGRITRQERAQFALRYGQIADWLLTRGATMVGSGLTPMAIVEANHHATNQARAAAGLPPLAEMAGVPVDIDVSAIMNGVPPEQAVTRTLLVVSSPARDASGTPIVGPKGPRWVLEGVYPGDDSPVLAAGQTVRSVPITTGMAVVYHLASVPRTYEGKIKRFAEEHEDTIRAAAAALTVGFHAYAVFNERAYRLKVRAEERARAQKEAAAAAAHRTAAAAAAPVADSSKADP